MSVEEQTKYSGINFTRGNPNLVILNRRVDIGPLGEKKTIAHITSQEVAILRPEDGGKGFENLLDENPQLEIVSVGPNLAGRLGSGPGFQRALSEHNVGYRVGTIMKNSDYSAATYVPRKPGVATYLEKLAYYQAAHIHPRMREELELMRAYKEGFLGVRIADAFFDPENMGKSIENITQDLGIDYALGRRDFVGVMAWMGMPYIEFTALASARSLAQRIEKAKEEGLTTGRG